MDPVTDGKSVVLHTIMTRFDSWRVHQYFFILRGCLGTPWLLHGCDAGSDSPAEYQFLSSCGVSGSISVLYSEGPSSILGQEHQFLSLNSDNGLNTPVLYSGNEGSNPS